MTTSDCNYRDNYYVITFTYVQMTLALVPTKSGNSSDKTKETQLI